MARPTRPPSVLARARCDDAGRRATRTTTTRPRRRDVDVAVGVAGARARAGRRRARATETRAIDPAHADAAREVHRALGDVAVGVGLPCTVQNCGDAIYRSTLDAELRREIAPLLTPVGATILAVAATYGLITPGVIPGVVDFYLLRPLLGTLRKRYALEDFALGKKLGEGGFGVVYEATGVNDQKKYVLKRATDYGEAEVWMNSRLQIACPGACADFVSAFEGPPVKKGDDEPSLWLVWKYEGKSTLFELMKDKNFPYNVEPYMFKDGEAPGGLPPGARRKSIIIGKILDQILDALARVHGTGIVHRDVKPENILFDESSGKFRLIDLGAAADLRSGVNYSPKDFIFDPRFKAPEEYIMSRQTPEAPVLPVALALSPVLWQLNLPDRFDMYSTGVMFLQMCLPNLRKDDDLIKFRRELEDNGNDLVAWRNNIASRVMKRPEVEEGFEVLDLDDRAGWRLVKGLMATEGRSRPAALGARGSRFVRGKSSALTVAEKLFPLPDEDSETNDENAFGKWLLFRVARSGTRKEGGFTEAQLREFEEDGNIDDVDTARKNLGMVATETLASYGVDKVERTLAERPNRQAKVPSSSGFDLKDIGDKLTSSFDEMFGERD
jgi:serine/threonine protein kinase